jgi:hypothetical protein
VVLGSLSDNSDQRSGISQQVASDGSGQTLALEALVRQLAPSQSYGQIIAADCNSASLPVCTFEDSKAVKGIVRIVPQGANPANTKSVYCFDLAFVPHIAVVSAFTSDNATVGTAAREDRPAAWGLRMQRRGLSWLTLRMTTKRSDTLSSSSSAALALSSTPCAAPRAIKQAGLGTLNRVVLVVLMGRGRERKW